MSSNRGIGFNFVLCLYFAISAFIGLFLTGTRVSASAHRNGNYIEVGDYHGHHLLNKFGVCIISDKNGSFDVSAATETGEPVIVGFTKTSDYDSFDKKGYVEYLFRYYDTSGNFIDSRNICVGNSDFDGRIEKSCDAYVSEEDSARETAIRQVKRMDGISM